MLAKHQMCMPPGIRTGASQQHNCSLPWDLILGLAAVCLCRWKLQQQELIGSLRRKVPSQRVSMTMSVASTGQGTTGAKRCSTWRRALTSQKVCHMSSRQSTRGPKSSLTQQRLYDASDGMKVSVRAYTGICASARLSHMRSVYISPIVGLLSLSLSSRCCVICRAEGHTTGQAGWGPDPVQAARRGGRLGGSGAMAH